MNTARSSAFVLISALLVSLLGGCVLYVPPSSFEATGHPVDRSQSGAIKKGRTTRAEVIRLLGRPSRESVHTNAIAYVWERDLGGFVYAGLIGGGVATPTFGPARAFVVAFDNRNVVRKTNFISLGGNSTVDDRMIEYGGYRAPLPAAEIVPARPPVQDLDLRITEPASEAETRANPAVDVFPRSEKSARPKKTVVPDVDLEPFGHR